MTTLEQDIIINGQVMCSAMYLLNYRRFHYQERWSAGLFFSNSQTLIPTTHQAALNVWKYYLSEDLATGPVFDLDLFSPSYRKQTNRPYEPVLRQGYNNSHVVSRRSIHKLLRDGWLASLLPFVKVFSLSIYIHIYSILLKISLSMQIDLWMNRNRHTHCWVYGRATRQWGGRRRGRRRCNSRQTPWMRLTSRSPPFPKFLSLRRRAQTLTASFVPNWLPPLPMTDQLSSTPPSNRHPRCQSARSTLFQNAPFPPPSSALRFQERDVIASVTASPLYPQGRMARCRWMVKTTIVSRATLRQRTSAVRRKGPYLHSIVLSSWNV